MNINGINQQPFNRVDAYLEIARIVAQDNNHNLNQAIALAQRIACRSCTSYCSRAPSRP